MSAKSKSKSSVKALDTQTEEKKIHEEFSSRYNELSEMSGTAASSSAPQIIGDGFPNPYAANPVLPFDDTEQQVVLLNITHRQQIPKSKIPGFRVCGAFKDLEKLKRHALNSGGPAAYGGSNLIKADVHKKFLICSSLEKQQNASYVLGKIEELAKKYTQTLKFHADEFKENKENRQQGKTGLSQSEKVKKISSRKQLLDKKFEDDKEKGTETGEVSRVAEVRNQSVAVVTIMSDTTATVLNGAEDPEPIVIVWGCFENEAQAKHYIYNTASKFVKDVMLDVVNMYEWVFPTEIEKRVDELTEEFRNPSLNKVMNSRKAQKKSVMSYSDWCKQEGQEPAMLEISATKETEESTDVKTEVRKTEDFKISVSTKEDEKNKDSDDVKVESAVTTTVAPSLPVPTPNIFERSDWKPVVQSQVNELYKDVTFKDTNNGDDPTTGRSPITSSDLRGCLLEDLGDQEKKGTSDAKKRRGRPKKK